MKKPNRLPFIVGICGSSDFVRRMSATVRTTYESNPRIECVLHSGNLLETKAIALSEKPHLLLLDISFLTTERDLVWIRSVLSQLRERLARSIHIVLAVTAPERFFGGGNLLFSDDNTQRPSGLIDNIIVAPPPAVPGVMGIEEQIVNVIDLLAERLLANPQSTIGDLPALYDDSWVPVMADPSSREVWMRWLPRYARYINENPLIVGPTGSGKTRLASAIHALSGRDGPFISITPRDFSSSELVQAELFGSVAGAYTGAVDKWGLVRKAERGTLFIDELQSIDHDLQGKLITFIENKVYRRVGEAESQTADVRFIFATNRPLKELVDDGRLRDDFAYRLERLQIELPPLERRRLDIAAGLCFCLAKVVRERLVATADSRDSILSQSIIKGFTSKAYRLLFSADWPGNLRQLENTIAKLIEFARIRELDLIDEHCASNAINSMLGHRIVNSSDVFLRAAERLLRDNISKPVAEFSDYLRRASTNARAIALEATGGDVNRAAQLIGDSKHALEIFSESHTAKIPHSFIGSATED
jgi:transcriptional regulator with AAA-type ATPase domain